MIDTNAFVALLDDLKTAPTPTAGASLSHASINSYINQYPSMAQSYILTTATAYTGSLKIDKTRPFVFMEEITRTGNSFIAGTYMTLSHYPSANTWSLKEFINFLNLIEFDVALYLFHVFYAKHHTNHSFTEDLRVCLAQQVSDGEIYFAQNFYNLIRLFVINKVITPVHTDIIDLFLEELDQAQPSQQNNPA